jgi:hypothetical protein
MIELLKLQVASRSRGLTGFLYYSARDRNAIYIHLLLASVLSIGQTSLDIMKFKPMNWYLVSVVLKFKVPVLK